MGNRGTVLENALKRSREITMTDEKKSSKFNEVMSALLADRLRYFSDAQKKLDLPTCVEMYQVIFNTLVDVINTTKTKTSGFNLTNESVNYIAQLYYDGIVINEKTSQRLDPNIFSQRAKLENIETKELTLLAMLLNHTEFVVPIITEIKRRS